MSHNNIKGLRNFLAAPLGTFSEPNLDQDPQKIRYEAAGQERSRGFFASIPNRGKTTMTTVVGSL